MAKTLLFVLRPARPMKGTTTATRQILNAPFIVDEKERQVLLDALALKYPTAEVFEVESAGLLADIATKGTIPAPAKPAPTAPVIL